MIYSNFKGKKLSLLGFGTMRLPLLDKQDASSIDKELTEKMIDRAIDSGINYFDTAYPYHAGLSELVIGKILKKYPRDTYYIATKYPGHQISDSYDPAAVFEDQLRKCGVEYFDFYLLHNVYENSFSTYTDPKWSVTDYFIEQKKLGRIKHLGFSTHGGIDIMKKFLDLYGEEMEFCQIQLNYLDWSLQNAKEKCELLKSCNIPVWVMEPVRGGRLASLDDESTRKLRALRPDESTAAWAFRWLQGLDNIGMILSGMSNLEQMEENIQTFEELKPLNEQEEKLILDIAEGMKNSLPCTACRYCTDGCPMNLDIPMFMEIYNEMRFSPNMNASMKVEFMPEDKQPSKCIGCGNCTAVCPQKIDIPSALSKLCELLKKVPSWKDISRQRVEEAKKLKNSASQN